MIIDFGLPKNCMILSSVNNPQYKKEMKIIKNLTVKMTYRVGLGNVEVPDDVYDFLQNAMMKVEMFQCLTKVTKTLRKHMNGFLIISEKRMQWIGNMR